MKVGSLTFITLEDFKPAWRQAVVVKTGRKGVIYLAARVTEAEAKKKSEDFTIFELEGERFVLVEGSQSKTRSKCTQSHRALELEAADVAAKALSILDSEDLDVCFATASEELIEGKAVKNVAPFLKEDSSDSSLSEESGESEGEDLLRMLNKASRAKNVIQGGATGSGEVSRPSRANKAQYPLLEGKEFKKDKDNSASSLDKLLQLQLAGNGKLMSGDQINALLQMEILKTLKGKGYSTKEVSKGSSDSSDSEAASSSDTKEKLRGAGKAMRAYRREKKEMLKNPRRHIRRYIREVEETLGVSRDTPYLLTDFTRKISWGKHRTLMRLHWATSDTLQLLLRGKVDRAALQLTQTLRALHQCALDNGEWRTAWLLLHLQDPAERPKFGGDPHQLETVASYVKAMNELEKKSRVPPTPVPGDTTAPPKGSKKGKNRKNQGADDQENLEA